MSGRPKVVGIVGAIGAGKSRVAALLAELGAAVLSGDETGHEVLREPEIAQQVAEAFGRSVLTSDGAIDRRPLGRIVFADPDALRRLEVIVHPHIGRRLRERMESLAEDPQIPLIVIDAAVMLEAGWTRGIDEIVYVDAEPRSRAARVAGRGWSPDELARREAAQWPAERKRLHANHILVNDDWETCRAEVETLYRKWTEAPTAAERPALSPV